MLYCYIVYFSKFFLSIYSNYFTFYYLSIKICIDIYVYRSPDECGDWSKLILDTVTAHKSDQEETSGYIAPVWTPDSDCTQCELCATQFTVIQRRHHCRNCGAVVCDACSKKRFLVTHIHQTKESRVCDPCHGDLTETSGTGTGNEVDGNGDISGEEASSVPVKSNLPRRGRQSVILRGLEADDPMQLQLNDSGGSNTKGTIKNRLSYTQRESTGEDGIVSVENPIRAYFSSLLGKKPSTSGTSASNSPIKTDSVVRSAPPPPTSLPPANTGNMPPPPPSMPPPPPPDPSSLPKKPLVPTGTPTIQVMK